MTPVEVSLPGGRHSPQSWRNLEHHDSSLGRHKIVDFFKTDVVVRVLGNLPFQTIERRAIRSVIGPTDLPGRLVSYTKDEPTRRLPLQVGLVAESREVLTKVVEIIVVFSLLELHPLSLRRQSHQFLKLGLKFRRR